MNAGKRKGAESEEKNTFNRSQRLVGITRPLNKYKFQKKFLIRRVEWCGVPTQGA